MTERDQYLKMRNNRHFDINWLHNHFIKNGGEKIEINTFFQAVNLYSVDRICEGLDTKFAINKITDLKTQQDIKYY